MAKHEVQLTNDSKDIYWEDVDVSKGVYAKDSKETDFYFLGTDNKGYCKRYLNGCESAYTWSTLKELLDDNSHTNFYYIPDNRRITTTKALTLEDLKENDIIGTVDKSGLKGYIVNTGESDEPDDIEYTLVSYDDTAAYQRRFGSRLGILNEALESNNSKHKIVAIYRFDTRKELYQWLAED